jgi:hypothetical protein
VTVFTLTCLVLTVFTLTCLLVTVFTLTCLVVTVFTLTCLVVTVFTLTCLVVTSMLVMGAPLWSLMTRTVTPVVGLLTAISPSLPPEMIILPATM